MARVAPKHSQIWKPYDRPSTTARRMILIIFLIFLALPLTGMVYFTFRSATGGFTFDHWAELFSAGESSSWDLLATGVINSVILVIVTIAIEYVIVIPALIVIHVKLPRIHRAMRVLMLLPIAIPAIILVVGFAPIFAVVADYVSSDSWTLALAYGVIALPFVYTTIDADLNGLNASTITEAAQSLGANWWTILTGLIVPCLRKSIISATLITTAIVLGEFTIASLLNRDTLQTELITISQSDVYLSVIITLIVLVLTFIALFLVSGFGRKKDHQ
ncbi:ABC transporter permease [Bifidobacterium sp.]|uniref:ABC transporter permease n=1 Tax=Bifidobacterium sp. TaxID=41200 RepID=UPI0025C03B8D|nr:ABC transporter permease subunit [Bifidobacterium sp.]MCI1635338.1 ABC transporter permease subunit [Bifidobacterium sp.]